MNFHVGSIPVRIRASFFMIALFFASSFQRPAQVAVAAGVVLVSVLVHELGHALLGRVFGLVPEIELHGMGGTTSWSEGRTLGHGRSIVVSLAGPVAGFGLAGVALVAELLGLRPQNVLAQLAIELVIYVNVRWGIMNLVPLLPLDGGNVMRSFLHVVTKGRGEKPARVVSVVTGGLFLLYGAVTGSLWIAFLGAMFTYTNIQAFRQHDQRSVDAPLAQAIEKAYVALDRQDGAEAVALLRPVLVPQAAPELRELGLRLFAYGLLLEGRWGELMPLLETERGVIGAAELSRYARTARELGHGEEAGRIEALASA